MSVSKTLDNTSSGDQSADVFRSAETRAITGEERSPNISLREFEAARPLLDRLGYLVLLLDRNGSMTFVNQALRSVLGLENAECEFVNWNDKYSVATDQIEGVTAIQAILTDGICPDAFRQQIQIPGGDLISISWRPAVVREEDDVLAGLLLCGFQTTAPKVAGDSPVVPVSDLDNQVRSLSNRIRELTCLIEIGKLEEQPGLPIPRFLKRCVDLIPSMWSRPEHIHSRITFDGEAYAADGYPESMLCLTAELVIDGVVRGGVEIGYVECGPDSCSGLQDGQLLLDTVTQDVADHLSRRQAVEDLYQQKLLLDNIITNIPQHVFWKDRDLVFQGCNANFAHVAGVAEPADLIGKTDYDLVWSREESDWYRSCDKKVMDDGNPLINIDETQTRADGKVTRVLTSKVPLRDSKGEVVGLLGMYADVTELREVQEAVSKINDMLAALIEASPVAIVMFDTSASVTVWNPAAERIFGWQAYEVVGQKPPYIAEAQREEYNSIWKSVLAGEPVQNLGVIRQRKDRSSVEINLSAAAVHDNAGNVIGAISIHQDVTDYKEAERALARSEVRYRSIFESLTDVYFETSLDSTILEMSPSAQVIFGLTPDKLIGRPSTDWYRSPETRLVFVDTIMAEGEVKDYEITLVRADGSDVPVAISARLVRDDQGAPLKLQGIIHDITQRRQTEQKIRETMAQLNATLNALPDMLFEVDANGYIHSFHTQAKDTLFLSPKLFLGRTVQEVLPADAAEIIMNAIARAMTEGTVRGVSYSLPTPEGTRWYEMSLTPKGDPVATDARLIAITRDITDRRKAQDELTLTTARYTTLINTVPAVMYVKDANQAYVTGNLELCRLANRPIDQIIGYTTEDLFPGEFGRCLSEADREAVASDQEMAIAEQRLVFPDGEERWVSSTRVPLHDQQGRVTGLVGLLQDVTDQRRSRGRLVQADKLAAIGTLAAGVAHEINNPIGFISSNLHTMSKYLQKIQQILAKPGGIAGEERGTLDEMLTDFGDAVSESLEGTTRVRNIVADLKSFSRVDRAEKELANLNEGICSTLNIVWNELKYTCKVEKDLGDLPDLFCIPNQLNQVFMNILINAGHAIKGDQGTIKIRTWSDEQNVYVSFEDNGEGIAPANLKKIFEPFFTTKEVGKGTGLGLSLAYDIVKKHHGDIDVWSEVGTGTRFTIALSRDGVNE